jgi:citrate lyase subunit beta / citryl-CoA lyase
VEAAQAIIAAFAAAPGAGAIQLNGTMLDRPHLASAQRVLARAGLA